MNLINTYYMHINTLNLHSTILSWEAEGLLIMMYHDEETRLVIREACTARSGSHDKSRQQARPRSRNIPLPSPTLMQRI